MKSSDKKLIKINLNGGYISAGDLYEVLLVAENAGARRVRFGNRQQLYFTTGDDGQEDLENEMLRTEIQYEADSDSYPNIVSSYVADTIFNQEGWLREGVYKDILDMFDYQPRLKINLVDNQQTFVPFFSGNINFIASNTCNYWFMYIRFPKTGKLYCFPSLIYSDDIASTAKMAEEIILENKEFFYDQVKADETLFQKMLLKKSKAAFQPITEALKLPDFYLPYYEGFNKYNNKYWLGIYRRDELFPIDFLKDLCLLCLQKRIGQIYTTPWKSIIIKGIDPADRYEWGLILSKYRLNIRHAANELNWQIEDICEVGLDLKKRLVREFEEADLRTYQLCFAIKTQPKTGLPGSIIIKKSAKNSFDLLHTRDFNPNSKDFIVYQQNVAADNLSEHLIALCGEFYGMQIRANPSQANTTAFEQPKGVNKTKQVHQCKNCMTIYDEDYGDELNGINPGTPFDTLNEYLCPTCETGKEEFVCVEKLIVSSLS
jgi:rubredoxin